MIIPAETEMLLFRYSNYRNHHFVDEHKAVIDEKKYVWMLKLGKKSSIEKIRAIKEAGGWIVLRAPKSEGGISYIASFSEYSDTEPTNKCYPKYYKEILENMDEDDSFIITDPAFQWFKLTSISILDEKNAQCLVVSKTGKAVDEVIETTRTAVMYIKNSKPISL